jgi:hypothetical protein
MIITHQKKLNSKMKGKEGRRDDNVGGGRQERRDKMF